VGQGPAPHHRGGRNRRHLRERHGPGGLATANLDSGGREANSSAKS
jgi:hypothetical protein